VLKEASACVEIQANKKNKNKNKIPKVVTKPLSTLEPFFHALQFFHAALFEPVR